MTGLIKDFHPIWFVSVMGTGITSNILYASMIDGSKWIHILSYIMFGITTLLLLITGTMFFTGILFHDTLKTHLFDLKNNLFWGCMIMGFNSWCNFLFYLNVNIIVVFILWWINISMSIICAVFIFSQLIKTIKFDSIDLNSTFLLPFVPLTVVSTFGGVILKSLPQNLQKFSLIITYILWSNSMILSFIITTLYIYRLFIHKVPTMAIFTTFIPLGYLGQGALAIQLFGVNYVYLYPDQSSIHHITILVGLFLESFGFFMTLVAFIMIFHHIKTIKLNKGLWAMTFPLGTMCQSLNETYKLTDMLPFKVVSLIYGFMLFIIVGTCLVISVKTAFSALRTSRKKRDIENQLEKN